MGEVIQYIENHDGFFMLILTLFCVIANILTVLLAQKQNSDNRKQFKESLRISALPLLHLETPDDEVIPDGEDFLVLNTYGLSKSTIEFSVFIEMSNWGSGLAQEVYYAWNKEISCQSAGHVVSLAPKDTRCLKVHFVLPDCNREFQIGFRLFYMDIYSNKYMQHGSLFIECSNGKAQFKKQYISAPIYLGVEKEKKNERKSKRRLRQWKKNK